MFICMLCQGLLHEPITINCGHTFCRKCLEREPSKGRGPTCKKCGSAQYRLNPANIGTNVVLSNLLKKWFPARSKAAQLKVEGNDHFETRDFQRAITLYSEAVSFFDADHLLFSSRSHAYASLQQYDKALEDAEKAVAMRPDWPKGYFRKGNALLELGHYEDAAITFLQCLALDPDVILAKENLSKSLYTILSKPMPGEDPQNAEQHSQPQSDLSKFRAVVSGSVDMDALKPHLPAATWRQLKQMMGEEEEEDVEMEDVSPPSSPATSLSSGAAAVDSGIKSSAIDADCPEYFQAVKWKSKFTFRAPFVIGDPIPQPPSRAQSKGRENKEVDGQASEEGCSCNNNPTSPQQPETPANGSGQKSLDDGSLPLTVEDMECSLCYRLFYQPVTTPCGHTFCRECVDRCLDHQISCPMCKSSLAQYLAERRSAVVECLQSIVVTFFPEEHAERQQIHEDEMSELARMGRDRQHDIPIFVCTLGFPTILCPLHVFEPRYRLMIRQCVEAGTRQFGMCACVGDTEEEFTEYGCMLEVKDVYYFPDGRSLVNTVGDRRFRVLGQGKRDGYNTAKVEFLHDQPIAQADMTEIEAEQRQVHSSVKTWLSGQSAFHRARIDQHYGNLPEPDPNPGASGPNGPKWVWWAAAVLPLDPGAQLALLASCGYRERLDRLKQVLEGLRPGSA